MNKSFWDRDGNGRTDIVDIFWLVLQLIAYGAGAVLMLTTFTRSFHLLSSDQLNPGRFWWWPWLTAASPEAGLIIAWLAGEVGFRKGRLELVSLAIVGFASFGVIIGTMQLYDVALIEGQDITLAQTWMHWVASILPLFTIAYSAGASMLLSYMARREMLRSGRAWTIQESRPNPVALPSAARREEYYGGPITDPLDRSRPANPDRPKVHPRPRRTNRQGENAETITRALDRIRSIGSNGAGAEESDEGPNTPNFP